MALPANALTTVAAIQAAATNANGAGNTAAIERLIAVASDAIERYCGRSFGKSQRTEIHAPPLGERLIVEATPIDAQAAITATLAGSALSGIEVEDARLGFLFLRGGWGGAAYERAVPGSCVGACVAGSARRVLAVTYTGGYALPSAQTPTLPADIEQACVDTVISLWRKRGADLSAPIFDGANEAIGRAMGGLIPGPVLPTLKRFMRVF